MGWPPYCFSGCLAPNYFRGGREEKPVSDEAFKIPDLWPVPKPIVAQVVGDSSSCTTATQTVIMPH
jgi:hypothetical protein